MRRRSSRWRRCAFCNAKDGPRIAQEQAAELNGALQERSTKLAQAEAQVRHLTKALEDAQAATAAAHASAREQLTLQARNHEEERRLSAERAAANERRLNAEVDRARQDAKAARDEGLRAVARVEVERERHAEAARQAGERAEQLHRECEQLRTQLAQSRQASAGAEAATREAAQAESAARELHALAQARIEDLTASLASERHAAETLREQLTAALRRPPPSRPGKAPRPER